MHARSAAKGDNHDSSPNSRHTNAGDLSAPGGSVFGLGESVIDSPGNRWANARQYRYVGLAGVGVHTPHFSGVAFLSPYNSLRSDSHLRPWVDLLHSSDHQCVQELSQASIYSYHDNCHRPPWLWCSRLGSVESNACSHELRFGTVSFQYYSLDQHLPSCSGTGYSPRAFGLQSVFLRICCHT